MTAQQCLIAESYRATYATWNPATVGAGIALSGGNLIATQSNGTNATAASTFTVSSGKWYWEVKMTTQNGGFNCVGIAISGYSNTGTLGGDVDGWAYINGQRRYHNGTTNLYGASIVAGGVIGVYLDAGAGSVGFTYNGVDQGSAYTGLTGPFYAACSPDSSGGVMTANFGATSLTYTPPTGYAPGLYY